MSTVSDAGLQAFLGGLPKSETHLHIEGALPWELLQQLDAQRYAQPPASWQDGFVFPDFATFETELLSYAGAWFTSAQRYHDAAMLVFERLQREQGVVYVETSFASGMMEVMQLDGAEVAAAIAAAAPAGMAVRVFMGIHHNGYHSGSRDFIEASLRWPHLAGIDLHGTESFPVEDWTAPLWRRARAAGKLTKAHAGEFMGADMVRKVVKELGVRRVQHGVRAIEDPAVVDLLVRSGAVLDICPISNLKLGVVDDLRNHPLPALLDAGVSCTISTDDPVSFGNRLDMEYAALHHVMGFGYRELGALARTGLEQGADIPLVREALGRLDSWVAAFAAEADD